MKSRFDLVSSDAVMKHQQTVDAYSALSVSFFFFFSKLKAQSTEMLCFLTRLLREVLTGTRVSPFFSMKFNLS